MILSRISLKKNWTLKLSQKASELIFFYLVYNFFSPSSSLDVECSAVCAYTILVIDNSFVDKKIFFRISIVMNIHGVHQLDVLFYL